jgi:hypothetical protein
LQKNKDLNISVADLEYALQEIIAQKEKESHNKTQNRNYIII